VDDYRRLTAPIKDGDKVVLLIHPENNQETVDTIYVVNHLGATPIWNKAP
jgi:hypothetical protein